MQRRAVRGGGQRAGPIILDNLKSHRNFNQTRWFWLLRTFCIVAPSSKFSWLVYESIDAKVTAKSNIAYSLKSCSFKDTSLQRAPGATLPRDVPAPRFQSPLPRGAPRDRPPATNTAARVWTRSHPERYLKNKLQSRLDLKWSWIL